MNRYTRNEPFRKSRWLIVALSVVVFCAILWGIQWATFARKLLPEAVKALESDDQVQVLTEPWLTFTPTQVTPSTGFVFYPGGRIDPRDHRATVDRVSQHDQILQQTLGLLETISRTD